MRYDILPSSRISLGVKILEFINRIIDAHAHIYPDNLAKRAAETVSAISSREVKHVGTVSEIKESGKRIGIKKQLVCSIATKATQVETINTFIANSCKENPGFIGFATMRVDYDHIEIELERIKELGLSGVKFHADYQQCEIDNLKAIEMYRKIAKAGLPILFHMGNGRHIVSEPRQLKKAMDAVPDLIVIAAHFGGYVRWGNDVLCLKDIKQYLYFDTSSSLAYMSGDDTLKLIETFGEDRFFFGTDFPMWDHMEELKRFLGLPLSDVQREKILYLNFERFTDMLGNSKNLPRKNTDERI